MHVIDTVVVGGGQAGLAMSASLSQRGVEHIVLERGRTGERWRSERWESLRLLTPRWLSRVHGWSGPGEEVGGDADGARHPRGDGGPDGFMTRSELVAYLEAFAGAFRVPLETGVTVRSVVQDGDGFRVATDRGLWRARRVVVATGACQTPHVPAFAAELAPHLVQVTTDRYRRPSDLPPGGVLVVGASATGVQLADEIRRSGRSVTLAVGRHTRLPRSYRGRDILSWFHAMGVLDEPTASLADAEVSRAQPSLQLVGSPDRRTLDLGTLHAAGVRLVGRAVAADGVRMEFADELIETIAAADVKLARLRLDIDRWIAARGLDASSGPPEPFLPSPLPGGPTRLSLADEGIATVVWATGFRRSYPWLRVPVLDGRGELVQRGGATRVPGLFTLGLNLMRRRSSTFLHGVGQDAEELADAFFTERVRADVRRGAA